VPAGADATATDAPWRALVESVGQAHGRAVVETAVAARLAASMTRNGKRVRVDSTPPRRAVTCLGAAAGY
jgi:hypothetical protein